jgi:aquaporin Z
MKNYIIEFLGTMFLMFIILTTGNYLAIGSALALAVIMGGAISGTAYNPAVALALMYMGKLPTKDLVPYIVAQISGALVAVHLYNFYKMKFI